MGPRALIQPPGVPSFLDRKRYVTTGTHTWTGKAWVGGGLYRAVMAVDVSLDDGMTWRRAQLEPRLGIFGWHKFTVTLHLEAGVYTVRVRAAGPVGDVQKSKLTSDDWNWHGMNDNACQTIEVVAVNSMTITS